MKRLLIIIFAVLAIFAVFGIVSVYPTVWYIRFMFKMNPYSMPADYESLKEKITILRDIDYNSAYKNGVLDIIRPKTLRGDEPVIFYTHGGGFIEGDKTDVEHYFVMLANEGFVTVNINYALDPEAGFYPTPVLQLKEVYLYIKNNAAQYDLSMDTVYFGGDSAGAQVSVQFMLTQDSPGYLELFNKTSPKTPIEAVLPLESVKGILLFCGLYDMKEMFNPPPNTMPLPFSKLGKAYFRTTDETSVIFDTASLIDKVTGGFPRAFITDGSYRSFEDQAKRLEAALKSKGVPVDAVYYDDVPLGHVYQFRMADEYAQKTYVKVLDFLKQ